MLNHGASSVDATIHAPDSTYAGYGTDLDPGEMTGDAIRQRHIGIKVEEAQNLWDRCCSWWRPRLDPLCLASQRRGTVLGQPPTATCR